MLGKRFAPRLESVEDRLALSVAVPGVVFAPTDFFGGPAQLIDFDRTPDGTAIPANVPINTQYASFGVTFAIAGHAESPNTNDPFYTDEVSRPNSLYNGSANADGSGAATVITFDPAVRSPLPTAVGFVFTDSPQNDPFTARAFDAAGNLVDQATINTANGSAVPVAGETEDTFVGLQSGGGIARVELSIAQTVVGPIFGFEIDNLRFNTPGVTSPPPPPLPPPPPPGTPPPTGGVPPGTGTPAPGFQRPDLAVASANTSAQVYRLGSNDQLTAQGGPGNPFGLPGVVRAASGDVDGDGSTDVIYATGPGGGGLVRIVSGRDGTDLLSGGRFDAFPGENITAVGVFVAAGDIDGDGKSEVVISPDRGGGPRVQIFSFANGTLNRVANFFGINDPNFRGGARIAMGNFNGDQFVDLLVAAGIGGGPRVAVYSGATLLSGSPRTFVNDFFIFEQTLRDGVFVGAGDLDGNGQAELVFGGGPGGGPRVLALQAAAAFQDPEAAKARPYANFFAFDPNQRGGVRVAVKRVDGEDRSDLVVGSGDGAASQVRVYRGSNLGGSPSAAQGIDLFGAPPVASGVYVG